MTKRDAPHDGNGACGEHEGRRADGRRGDCIVTVGANVAGANVARKRPRNWPAEPCLAETKETRGEAEPTGGEATVLL